MVRERSFVMPGFNDIASYLGLAGALTIAVAMRGACTLAEKSARPEALREISVILKNVSWWSDPNPSSIVEKIFNWTFGARHLSLKCLKVSVLATFAINLALLLILHHSLADTFQGSFELVRHSAPSLGYWGAATVLLCSGVLMMLLCVIPDYLALAKTRLLIKLASLKFIVRGVLIVMLDVVLSLAISVAWFFFLIGFFMWVMFGVPLVPVYAGVFFSTVAADFHGVLTGGRIEWMTVSALSTLLTTIWTALIFLSTTALKLIMPIQRVTTWFFDVDNHPIEAVGNVSAVLVVVVSLGWSLVKAVV
jgi:hypothetical protein